MCMIIDDIKRILFNQISIVTCAFNTINIVLKMSIYNVDKYRNLVKMIVFTLYLLLCNKCVLFSKSTTNKIVLGVKTSRDCLN